MCQPGFYMNDSFSCVESGETVFDSVKGTFLKEVFFYAVLLFLI